METTRQFSRVQRVRHELVRRDVTVVRVQTLSPNFVSITFAGDSLTGFVSNSFDDHVKFMIADTNGDVVRRDYTPRHFSSDARELTIEFAMHGSGGIDTWVRQATPGQTAVIGGPRGSLIIPIDYDWHLLVGDAAALPAIHRRLEELPAEARTIVIVQVSDVADRRDFNVTAHPTVHWVSSAEELVDTVRSVQLPGGDGFAWCAGEGDTMKQLREVLLSDKAHPQHAMRVAAYWRRGDVGFHEALVNPTDGAQEVRG